MPPFDRAAFAAFVAAARPRLHRYCARMTGSVIDGEDVLQEALTKAVASLDQGAAVDNPETWIFRIAHNAALDLVRRRVRERAVLSEEEVPMVTEDAPSADERLASTAALGAFMRLPAGQRSSVILMDVLGYSLEEISSIVRSTVPAIKASLHRGRGRLRALANEPDNAVPFTLSPSEHAALSAYVDRFNAHDFDAVREMLAREVQLELVAKTSMKGKEEVQTYFHNYAGTKDWRLGPGLVEGRPAVLVYEPSRPAAPPLYFVLQEWSGNKLVRIRDFRYARYVTDGAAMVPLD